MSKHFILAVVILITLTVNGCSSDSDTAKTYKLLRYSEGENSFGQFQLDYYGNSYYDETEYEINKSIDMEVCGESFTGEYLGKDRMSPFLNELHKYGVVNSIETYDHDYSAWAWVNPKSGEVVVYSSWYETERKREEIYSEQNLTEIANQLASQYIDLNEYELTVKKRSDTDDSDYIFYYNRSINNIDGAGRIVIFLTCDGHLLAFHNTMNTEWDHAVKLMGLEYYQQITNTLTSEEAVREINAVFDKTEISKWEIVGKSLILMDETKIAVCYTIQYQLIIEDVLYEDSVSILVIE